MKSLLRWGIQNTPAMNTLMVAAMVVGGLCLWQMRREVFPEFDLEIILVSVPYPGASPDEVEEGICQKIEEAVRPIEGIKKQTSVAQEGSGFLVIELESDVKDVQKVLNEVRSEVDRIPSFPLMAEDPEIQQITMREPVIRLGIVGPDSDDPDAELRLRAVAEQVRDDLLQRPAVSQAEILGAREFQIDVEIPEDTLRKYGMTLRQAADIIRRENIELPGGTMRTDAQEVLLRGKNKRTVGEDIADIPLVTAPGGVVLTVGDLGVVRDEFNDTITSVSRINGRPGLVISVERTTSEDLLAMTEDVHGYVAGKKLPPGYELMVWGDQSVEVRDRLRMLAENGLQGLVLVFILLALFLETRLAFWVALGIPFSLLFTCAILYFSGHTLNMLTSFAFLMVIGILVDDAIVVGENVYVHRQLGKGHLQAAIDGTYEVLPSVIASVITTVIAFVPLLYVSGVMGKFIAVMPIAVIGALLTSLFEAAFILPCHLAHKASTETLVQRTERWRDNMSRPLALTVGNALVVWAYLGTHLGYPVVRFGHFVNWLNSKASGGLQAFTLRIYRPGVRWAVDNASITLSAALAMLMISVGLVGAGFAPFNIFPKMDSNQIEARVVYPDGTPASVAMAATDRMEQAILDLNARYKQQGESVVQVVHRAVGTVTGQGSLGPDTRTTGSNVGGVNVELFDTQTRTIQSQDVIRDWRALAGQFPGAETITFGSPAMGPGGKPIEFKLLADGSQMEQLEAAVDETKAKLKSYAGVFDVADDSRPGKWEFQLTVKPDAMSMGVPLAELAETVRAAYYGEEVMRLQRGRHEVKLMVRYPREDRKSLADFEEIRIRGADGVERPITELAEVRVDRGFSEINRIDQMRSVTISADVNESEANAQEITSELANAFMPELLERYPGLRVRWEGQREQTNESFSSLLLGLFVALIAMFVLLTMEFRSYLQPLMILVIIPFGIIGAIWGHLLLGMDLTLFSLFGIVALTGVVVNDSIVLIDFINYRVADGLPIKEALVDAGTQRLRAVFLTSVTTIAGLLPILMEKSLQAQIVIPMATSLAFGLMASTVLTLFITPALYYVYTLMTGGGAHRPDEEVDESQVMASSSDGSASDPRRTVPAESTVVANGDGQGLEPGNGHSPSRRETQKHAKTVT